MDDEILRLKAQLRQATEAELAERVRQHQLRVDRIRAGVRNRETLQLAVPETPLDFLAMGDSWFEYPLSDDGLPLPFWNAAIVGRKQLQSMGNPPPLVLSHALHGQAMTAILSWRNQERFIQAITDKTRWVNGKPDAILLSGGGDDIVGDQFAIYVDYGGGGLDKDRFQGLLASVEASYKDLFALRDRFLPDTPIFAHCYDYAIPNEVHPIFSGPWLQPPLHFAGYTYSQGLAIVKDAIDGFHQLLSKLADGRNFILVDTRGTLTRDASRPMGWANEIHPYTAGFTALAHKFLVALQGRFPGRI